MQAPAIEVEDAPPRTPDSLPVVQPTVLAVLFAISFSHLLNDIIQALIPAIYPVLHESFKLNLPQIGWITFTFQCTASLFQPLVGWALDHRPQPYSMAFGMGLSLLGLLALSMATSFPFILVAAATVGLGSAIFHPEASRVAHAAAGPRRGFAQSLFQLGGNAGTAIGAGAATIVAGGLGHLSWFAVLALIGAIVLWQIGTWQKNHHLRTKRQAKTSGATKSPVSKQRVIVTLAVLITLVFSKYIYLTSLTSYYTFYLIDRFGVSIRTSQVFLFIFLASVAVGTFAGGPIGDWIGRKRVIWASILGVAPFSIALPHMGLVGTAVLTVFIGVILASAFSAMLVYAQELVPGKVGMISGLFYGLAFGFAGIGSAFLGHLADRTSIEHVFTLCAYLPLIGLLAVLLPDIEPQQRKQQKATA